MNQFSLLGECFARTKPDLERDPRWAGSPFADVHNRSPVVSGKWAERAVRVWLQRNSIAAERPFDHTHDLVIGSKLIELKAKTSVDGCGRINQVRDQPYHAVLVLSLMPQDARAWMIAKDEIRLLVKPLHGGKRLDPTARIGFLDFDAYRPPAGWGDGNLDGFIESVRSGFPAGAGLFDAPPDFAEVRG